MQKHTETPCEKGVSAVILIYNEEAILRKQMLLLKEYMDTLSDDYEIILSENGSTDKSPSICAELAEQYECFKHTSFPRPSWGEATRSGFSKARFDKVFIYPVDLWGLDFIGRAIPLLKESHVVYGSRFVRGATHERPLMRTIPSLFNTFLTNIVLGTRFTDVNAVKMYRATTGSAIMRATSAMGPFIEIEIAALVRNCRLSFSEIPVAQTEMRTRHLSYILRAFATGLWKLLFECIRLRGLKTEICH